MDSLYVIGKAGLKKADDTYARFGKETPWSRKIGGLDQFITKSLSIKEKCEDVNVNGKDLKPIIDHEGIKLKVGDQPMQLTEWALMQFSNKVGIPSNYALSMAKAGKHELFLRNFESWLDSHHAGKPFLVRMHDDHIRGVLGPTYTPVDADFLLPRLQTGLQASNMNFRVDRGVVNPEYSNVRIISDHHIDIGGDPHFVGFRARSSDVGRSSIRVEFFVFRSRCENGMLFGRHGGILVDKIHTSKDMLKEGYFEQLLYEQLGRVDELVALTKEHLRDAQAKNLRDEDIQKVIDRFKSQSGFGKKDTEALFTEVKPRATAYGDNLTVWSVSNALTELAQHYPVERMEKIEDFAGDLLFARIA